MKNVPAAPNYPETIGEDGVRRPISDPSSLTTQQLQREIAALKEIIFTRLDGMDRAIALFNDSITAVPTDTDKQISNLKELHNQKFLNIDSIREIIETRLNGMDKAIELLQGTADKFPNRIDEKLLALGQVHEEQFRSITTQFAERDMRSMQSLRDSKMAADAALQAAKEAVGEQNRSSALAFAKSESATAKQIEQQGQLIQSMTKAVDDKIDDLKERLTRIEGKSEGGHESKAATHASGSYIATIIGALIGMAGFAIAIITLLFRK